MTHAASAGTTSVCMSHCIVTQVVYCIHTCTHKHCTRSARARHEYAHMHDARPAHMHAPTHLCSNWKIPVPMVAGMPMMMHSLTPTHSKDRGSGEDETGLGVGTCLKLVWEWIHAGI